MSPTEETGITYNLITQQVSKPDAERPYGGLYGYMIIGNHVAHDGLSIGT